MRLTSTPAPRPPSEPVRVCYVIDALAPAGTEGQLLALLQHLDRSKVCPTLCVLREPDADTRRQMPADCPALTLGLDRLVGRRGVAAAARLARFWRRHRVDVVQTYFLDSTYFAVPLARLYGI